MKLGIVSNCWQVQLEQLIPLEDLIDQARQAGYFIIELRQGSLGSFESPDGFPLCDRLAELPRRFPDVHFNLAMAVGFLNPRLPVDEQTLAAGIAGARALSGTFFPHLRFVDLTTAAADFPQIDARELAISLLNLAMPFVEKGGCLSVENAREPWALLVEAIRRAHNDRPALIDHLKICYDPTNLLMAADAPQASVATESLRADELSMVHFKQRQAGPVMTTVGDGIIDWSAQIAAINKIGYNGPGLFEIAPAVDVWENLSASRRYLENLDLPLDDSPE